MRKILYAFLILSIPVSFMLACHHPNADVQPAGAGSGNGGGGNGPSSPDTALCFERDVLPIFINHCTNEAGCHSGQDAASRQEGFVFNSYETIVSKEFEPGKPHKTELFEKITEDDRDERMPPWPRPALNQQQIDLIYRWIVQNAPKSTCISCDTAASRFATTIQPLLKANCQSCHSSSNASKGVSLDNYAGAQAVAGDGRLLAVVRHQPGFPQMPQGKPKLSNCQIRQLEIWISAGAPNN